MEISTIGLVLSVVTTSAAGIGLFLKLRERRRRLRLNLKSLLSLNAHQKIGVFGGAPVLSLEATNIGQKTVYLEFGGIELPDKRIIGSISHSSMLPVELPPGKMITLTFDAVSIVEYLREAGTIGRVRIVGLVKDQLGKIYKSPKMRLDPTEIEIWQRSLNDLE
ncbi:MAG: hypothetical protein IPM63_11600 [Acidobacteriota bacterium]|nr:MAG: hypothetical protein IPM63_11600 [Acidobacteriota bacterium]